MEERAVLSDQHIGPPAAAEHSAQEARRVGGMQWQRFVRRPPWLSSPLPRCVRESQWQVWVLLRRRMLLHMRVRWRLRLSGNE